LGKITPDLLALYTGIPSLSNSTVDNEVNYFCAYNFPAVVSRLGRDRWPEIRPTYLTLTKDTKFKVRRTLAYSIHDIAAILGTTITEKDLISSFDIFLRDLDQVRVGVISNLGKFLRVLGTELRIRYLETIKDIQRESDQNWRFRELLAMQMPFLSSLYPKKELATEVVPILLGLCRDRIATVRHIAVKSIGYFLLELREDDTFSELLQEIHLFALSETFMERQLYAIFQLSKLTPNLDSFSSANLCEPLFLVISLNMTSFLCWPL